MLSPQRYLVIAVSRLFLADRSGSMVLQSDGCTDCSVNHPVPGLHYSGVVNLRLPVLKVLSIKTLWNMRLFEEQGDAVTNNVHDSRSPRLQGVFDIGFETARSTESIVSVSE